MNNALIIDDSAFMRALLKESLKHHHIQVVGEAENGRIGVEKFKELNPDIVFLDIMMEEMMGNEALSLIIGHNPNAKVIMISSAIGQEPIIAECLAIGAKGILKKPPTDDAIAAVLNEL